LAEIGRLMTERDRPPGDSDMAQAFNAGQAIPKSRLVRRLSHEAGIDMKAERPLGLLVIEF
jgi:hypothetical protein